MTNVMNNPVLGFFRAAALKVGGLTVKAKEYIQEAVRFASLEGICPAVASMMGSGLKIVLCKSGGPTKGQDLHAAHAIMGLQPA